MGIVLSDFRPVHLTEPVCQEKLLEIAIGFDEWIAKANAGRDGASTAELSPGMIRAAWEKYGVAPKHIQSRRVSVLPDSEAAKEPGVCNILRRAASCLMCTPLPPLPSATEWLIEWG